MLLTFKNLTIRNAAAGDAVQLEKWWNDGNVMAHAGFPHGLGLTTEEIIKRLEKDADYVYRHLIIEVDKIPVGEMSYRNKGEKTVEIGIKICDFSFHNKGLGKIALSMMIFALFNTMGFRRIILDTNLNNKRAQHVYEQLGFRRLRVRENAWKNQLGEVQSSVDYELYPEDFINYAKEC